MILYSHYLNFMRRSSRERLFLRLPWGPIFRWQNLASLQGCKSAFLKGKIKLGGRHLLRNEDLIWYRLNFKGFNRNNDKSFFRSTRVTLNWRKGRWIIWCYKCSPFRVLRIMCSICPKRIEWVFLSTINILQTQQVTCIAGPLQASHWTRRQNDQRSRFWYTSPRAAFSFRVGRSSR